MQWNSVQMIQKRTGKSQDWFDENDEEIQGLFEEKHRKHKPYLSDTSSVSNKAAYSGIYKTVQTRLRDMQDSRLCSNADEIQSFAGKVLARVLLNRLNEHHEQSGTLP